MPIYSAFCLSSFEIAMVGERSALLVRGETSSTYPTKSLPISTYPLVRYFFFFFYITNEHYKRTFVISGMQVLVTRRKAIGSLQLSRQGGGPDHPYHYLDKGSAASIQPQNKVCFQSCERRVFRLSRKSFYFHSAGPSI